MSTSSLAAPTAARRGPGVALFGSEIGLVLRRRRNQVMLAMLAAVPVVVGVVLKIASPDAGSGDGPPSFIMQVTGNGLFLGFTALVLVTPFLMPLTVSVVVGDSVAGEAAQGTLRYLLTVPVSRGRVLAVKYVAAVVYGFVAALAVSTVGMVTGAALFPVSEVTLLSGDTIGLGETLVRALLMVTYSAVLLAGLSAVGLFVSTLTEVPVAAMAATVAVAVVAQILGAFPQLSALHPWLLTDTWTAFADLIREPIAWETIRRGVLTQGAYLAVFMSLAWARLTTRDVTS